MDVGVHLLAWPDRGRASANDFERRVRKADEYGFDRITTGDVQGNHLECYTALAYVAALTTRASLGPLTTHGVTRDPGVVAAAVASLDAISGGRAFFVLGQGDGSVRNVGLKPATVDQTREYFVAVRDLLRTGRAAYCGRSLKLDWPSETIRRVPLYLVAEGPRMLDLAGELADGVYLGTGFQPDVVAATVQRIRAAAERASRDANSIDLWWGTRCAVAPTRAAAVAAVRESLSSMGNHALRGDYEAKRVPASLIPALREYHLRYSYAAKNGLGVGPTNGDLMDELGLGHYFLDRFGVVGTPDDIVERLAQLRSLGIERVNLAADTDEQLRLLGEGVLPRLRL
jgi:5,10-methylenetetrahydromethanopterin reductase